jgi:CO/xanthine dehydrogenase Mo-binding subunit
MADVHDWWQWKVPPSGVIGKRGVRRKDGFEKASGKAVFTRDVIRLQMLYAKELLSPYAHAKIKSMDTSIAKALPGVRDILRYDDPDIKWPSWQGVPLVSDTALWFSLPVGAVVVAESEAICDQALKLIKIEWEQLPFLLDWHEALKPDAPLIRPDLNSKSNLKSDSVTQYGDVEKGFQEADKIIEFTVDKTEADTWAGVEPFSGVAEWKDDYLDVWHHGQQPRMAQETLMSHTAGSKITVHAPYNGSIFGGLEWLGYSVAFAHYAAIAAKRTGQPVKMLHDGSHFHGAGWEVGTYKFKVGFKNDGTVTAVKIESSYCNATLEKLWPTTKIVNQYLHKMDPYLNRAPTECYKHGGCACHVSTAIFDHVAGELKMDPTKIAIINDGAEGHDMAWVNENWKKEEGFEPRDSLKEVLDVGKKAIDWDNKWHLPGTRILPNGKYHGLGVTWQQGWNDFPQPAAAAVAILKDGTASVVARHADGGWNPATAHCRIVADELGLKYQDVNHRAFEDPGFDMRAGGGSLGINYNALPLIRAARKVKQMLLEYAVNPRQPTGFGVYVPNPKPAPAFFPNKKPEELDIKDGIIFEKANPSNKKTVAEVAATGSWFQIGVSQFYAQAVGSTLFSRRYYLRQCYFMEVEVDPETGQIDVTKMVVVNDVGRVVDPDSCNGQQYGGTYMGIGRCFTEAIVFDPQAGVMLNDNLLGYAIPLMNDCGPIDCHLVETGLGHGAYGMGGIGESAPANVCVLGGPAVYNAIGKWVDDFPITPAKILKALGKV